MGRGRSKGSGGGGSAKGATAAKAKATTKTQPQVQTANQYAWQTGANTPAGITHDEFMKLQAMQRERVIKDIINDQGIKVPAYLDDSETTKAIYALGMNNKPTVVPDAQLSAMKGKSLYRTVNGNPSISGAQIADQIKTWDYTQLSGKGGSVHGRALYFADNIRASASYYDGNGDGKMIRGKLLPGANIVDESVITALGNNNKLGSNYADRMGLTAICYGYDGWKSPNTGYYMMVNRGKLAVSDKTKSVDWYTKRW